MVVKNPDHILSNTVYGDQLDATQFQPSLRHTVGAFEHRRLVLARDRRPRVLAVRRRLLPMVDSIALLVKA